MGKECKSCEYQHPENKESCPALGKECRKCGKRNHFASRCKSKKVKLTDLEDDEAGEMYQIEASAMRLDDSQLVTLRLESGNFSPFPTRHCSPVQCAAIAYLQEGIQA